MFPILGEGLPEAEIVQWRNHVSAVASNLLGTEDRGPVQPPRCRKGFHPPLQPARGDVPIGDSGEFVASLDEINVPHDLILEFCGYCQEMLAAETLGSVLYEVADMPWEFYYDSARHLYDEIRHSNIGVDRLRDFGLSHRDVPQITFPYEQRMQLSPLDRYGVLTLVVEALAFPDMHQRHQRHLDRGDVKSAESVGYDIVDETMHVAFGHKWIPVMLKRSGDSRTIDQFGEYCRQRWEELVPGYFDGNQIESSPD